MASSAGSSAGSKPPYTYSEHNNQAKFVLVLDGLRVKRRLSNPLVKWPSNAQVLNQIINEQAINLAIELLKPSQKLYRFEIKRLPTPINPEKTKIKYGKDKVTVVLEKRVTDTWSTFADTDFETIHLVKN